MNEHRSIQNKQVCLARINNLCARFSSMVEKLYDTPDADDLIALIKALEEECGEYLKA